MYVSANLISHDSENSVYSYLIYHKKMYVANFTVRVMLAPWNWDQKRELLVCSVINIRLVFFKSALTVTGAFTACTFASSINRFFTIKHSFFRSVSLMQHPCFSSSIHLSIDITTLSSQITLSFQASMDLWMGFLSLNTSGTLATKKQRHMKLLRLLHVSNFSCWRAGKICSYSVWIHWWSFTRKGAMNTVMFSLKNVSLLFVIN